jgi:rhodanese-related sulfurtransferase
MLGHSSATITLDSYSGAFNLPYEFFGKAEKVLPDKRAEIIIYCMNEECEASREEARELEEMGYRHVVRSTGGKEGWIKAVLPVESGHHRA